MALPVHADVLPPVGARTMFKVAALVGDVPTSIFDGTTTFPLQQTVFQRALEAHGGGLYCFASIEECLARDDASFPPDSALLRLPRVILRVLAWDPPDQLVPVTYGHKRAFSYIRAVQAIPMPVSWILMRGLPLPGQSGSAGGGFGQQQQRDGQAGPAGSVGAGISEGVAAAAAAGSPAGAGGAVVGRTSPIPSPSPSRQLSRLQAQTLQLEMEVAASESRLRAARGLS